MSSVYLYDSPAKQTSYGEYDSILAALEGAGTQLTDCFIECTAGYTGEQADVRYDGVNASILFSGGNTPVSFGNYSFSLKGKIELGNNATVSQAGFFMSEKDSIVLGDAAYTSASQMIKAGDGNGNDKITLGSGATMLAGSTIYAAGDIDVGSKATMIAGSTIHADGKIDIKADASVKAEDASWGRIEALGGGIGVGAGATMIAGTTIYAAGTIDVKERATVKCTSGGIDADNSGANVGNILVGAGATMIAGTTIYADGKIELQNGAKVFVNTTDPSTPATETEPEYKFTGILVGDSAGMSAGASIDAAGGEIHVGSSSTMIAKTSIKAGGEIKVSAATVTVTDGTAGSIVASNGGITLLSDAYNNAYAVMSAVTIEAGGDIDVDAGATMSAGTSIKAKAGGHIDVGSGATVTAGTSIEAGGEINVSAGATVTVTHKTAGSIVASNGGITLLSDAYNNAYAVMSAVTIEAGEGIDVKAGATMTAGTSIKAGKGIDVGAGATVTVTDETAGSIVASNGGITLLSDNNAYAVMSAVTIEAGGDIDVKAGATMTAGTSIKAKAGGDIDVGAGATVTAGTSIEAGKGIDVGAGATVTVTDETAGSIVATNGGITLTGNSDPYGQTTVMSAVTIEAGGKIGVNANAVMSAGTSIEAGEGIDVDAGATVTVTDGTDGSIVATKGGITLTGNSDPYGQTTVMSAATINAGGKIGVNANAVMSAGSSVETTGGIEVMDGAKVFVGDGSDSAGIYVGANAKMSAGDSVETTGAINVGIGAKVFVNAADPSTTEPAYDFTGILVGKGVQMIAGSTIYADGKIEVSAGAAVKAEDEDWGGIFASGGIKLHDAVTVTDTDTEESVTKIAQMIAGTTIHADGKIEVGAGATVKVTSDGGAGGGIDAVGKDETNNGNIVLGEAAQMIAGNTIYASAFNVWDDEQQAYDYSGGNIVLGKDAQMTAGDKIRAASIDVGAGAIVKADDGVDYKYEDGIETYAGDIKLRENAQMIAGSTIAAAGSIDVGAGATVKAEEEAYIGGAIFANGGGIALAKDAQMIAGTTICAAGTIDVKAGATVKVTPEGYNGGGIFTTGGIKLHDAVTEESVTKTAQMIAGTTIHADGKIEVGTGAKVLIGSVTPAEGFTGIMLGARIGDTIVEMDAGKGVTAAAVTNAGTINLGLLANPDQGIAATAAPMTVTGAVTNTGTINIRNARLLGANEVGISAASIDNTAGTITVDATGFSGMKKVIDLAGTGVTITGNAPTVTGNDDAYLYYKADASDYYLTDIEQNPVYVDSDWTIGEFAANAKLSGVDVDKRYSLFNAFNTVNAAVLEAVKVGAGAHLIIQDGGTAYNEIIELNNVTTSIIREEGSSGTPSFNKAIYGGVKATAGTSGVDAGNSILIETGTFAKFVAGGSNINMSDKNTQYVINGKIDDESGRTIAHTLKINGGVFGSKSTGIVAGGDRFECGDLTVKGDVNTTINGGTFQYRVAGGMMNATTAMGMGNAKIKGNVNLTINGGTFDNDSHNVWIYGGCISAQRGDSENQISAQAEIEGNVTITVNSTDHEITLSSIVVGSHGWGKIDGDAKLVFTGSGSKIDFAENAQIWGSCSGDKLGPEGKIEDPTVTGKRTLSFTGFDGTLACEKIRGFSHIEFVEGSEVTLDDNCNLSDAENWTFENGSTLSGSGFKNDFTGDTFEFTGDATGFSVADVLTSVGESALTGFSEFSSVTLFDQTATWNGSDAYVTQGSGTNYKLYLNNDNTGMLVGTIA